MFKMPRHPAYLDTVKEFIEANYNKTLDATEIAFKANVSLSALQHEFKFAFGISINQLKRELRVNAAKLLLEDSNELIKTIAFRVGYKSMAGFEHAFKKVTGRLPSEYRKENP